MTKRILLALVLALLTFAPTAAAEGFESPLAGVGDWLKEVAAAIAEMGGLLDPVGVPQGDELDGHILPGSDPEPDGDGEMGGLQDPYGEPASGESESGEMGGLQDPYG